MGDPQDKWKYWQPVLKTDDFTVSGIISNHRISHFEDAFPSGKSNLMASSEDGKLIFLAVNDCINVYKSAEFSSKNPPDPSTFFPFNPVKILRPPPQRTQDGDRLFSFNHIRSGRINRSENIRDSQEILVAVGENGIILVWDIKNLDLERPVILENPDDHESTWGIAICKKYSLIATSSNSHSVTIFHYPSKQIIYSCKSEADGVHSHNIPSLDFSPCGRWLASCSIDSSVAVWSISEGFVTKMTLDRFKEWGWLVRFVSPSQYDDSSAKNKKVIKTFYHSTVEEASPIPPDDDFDDELYRNSRLTLERMFGIVYDNEEILYNHRDDTVSSDYTYSDDNLDPDTYDIDTDDDDSSDESPNKLVKLTLSDSESFRLFPVIEGVGHLAEGADDTWPEGDNEDLGYTPYKSDDDFSNFSGSDNELSDSESLTDYSDYDSNDSDSHSENSDSPKFNRSVITVNFENDFVNIPIHFACPYDLFYCTAESMFIIESSTGRIKLAIPRLIRKCFENQNENNSPDVDLNDDNFLLMNFLQNRLAMGEWIPELSVFLVIDCNGHLIILSPGSTNGLLDYNSVMFPDLLYIPDRQRQVIAYTVIRRVDEEFGVKVHVYLIHEDGTFKLYEIVKRIK